MDPAGSGYASHSSSLPPTLAHCGSVPDLTSWTESLRRRNMPESIPGFPPVPDLTSGTERLRASKSSNGLIISPRSHQ
jgi:hypothetical protein